MSDSNVAGYAAVGRSGKVYDLCVDDEADMDTVFAKLVENVEGYARGCGADRVSIAVPPGAESFANLLCLWTGDRCC